MSKVTSRFSVMVSVPIIIPTKNGADVLERRLKSIYSMDCLMNDVEVIVVGGHSTDDTVEIAERYGCKVSTRTWGS